MSVCSHKGCIPEFPCSRGQSTQRGDRIIKLGNISALNHNHCRALPELGQVAAKKESTLLVIVEDEYGNRRTCNIQPRAWNVGRGHFGFLVSELGEG